MLVPKKRENGWSWELYKASNTKKWHFLVSKALERCYANMMFVEFLDGAMQGESSNTGAAEENLESANAEQTYVCDPPAVENTIEGGQAKDYGPSMEANLGEVDERIVEQMEADDAEHVAFVDEFAGRRFDDEVDIPEDWVHIAPNAMTVDDGHHSSWVYSRIEVRQGQIFHDKVHLQHAVRRWAFSEKRQFMVVISNPTTWDVKCVTPGCTWRVHGHMPCIESNFITTIVEPHTCLLQSSLNKHWNMTMTFVANQIYSEVIEKLGISPFRANGLGHAAL
jgi:hypothetical protein